MMFSNNASRFFLEIAANLNAVTSAIVPDIVNLGDAAGISTVPHSSINGDIGVSPIESAALAGFDSDMETSGQYLTSSQLAGEAYMPDYVTPTQTG
jgi:hypothetical protein